MAKKLIGLRNYYVLLVMFLKKNNYVLEVNIMFLMQSVTTSKKNTFYTYYKWNFEFLHLLQIYFTLTTKPLNSQIKFTGGPSKIVEFGGLQK